MNYSIDQFNYSTYRFTLDIHKTKSQVSIPVLFQDTGTQFFINLTDGGKPYKISDGCKAVLYGKKPLFHADTGKYDCLLEDLEIIDSGTRIRYVFSDQTTTQLGSVACEIRLYSAEGLLLTSPAFEILVEARVIEDDEIIESADERTALDRIFESEAAREEAEAQRVETELERVEAEEAREKAEALRVEAEANRAAAEKSVINAAEAAEKSAEEAEESAEASAATAAKLVNYFTWFTKITDCGTIGLDYELSEDGTYYTLVGIGFAEGDELDIASHISGIPVTHIAESAFAGNLELASVDIPATLTAASGSSFNECTRLERVNISDIAAWCNIDFGKAYGNPLYYAENLYLNGVLVTNLKLPDSVTEIKDFVFFNGKQIGSVSLPAQCTSIGFSAFNGSGLKGHLTIPSSITTLSSFAFSKCVKLECVSFLGTPSTLTTLTNAYAFTNSVNIRNILVPWSEGAIEGAPWGAVNASIWYDFKEVVNDGIDYTMRKTTAGIYYGGYTNVGTCTDSDIVLPGTLETESGAQCQMYYIGDEAFANNTDIVNLYFGDSPTGTIYEQIGQRAFYQCTSLKNVILPDSIQSIGVEAFNGCKALTSINLPKGGRYKVIERHTFNNASLTYVSIPDSVYKIDQRAFNGCDFAELVIPASVTDWGTPNSSGAYYTFANNSKLTTVTFKGTPSYVPSCIFTNDTGITDIYVPWSEGAVANAPWGATNATIHYNSEV